MKVLKINCRTKESCHDDVKAIYPSMISLVHDPNNHLVIFASDYDKDGHVKKGSLQLTDKNELDSNARIRFEQIEEKEFV